MREWLPHVTVATVVEDQGRYLLVEERDKTTGKLVFNQPAGHLEEGETLIEAALRETLEETAWEVVVTAVLSIGLYTAPGNGVTYARICFQARALNKLDDRSIDPDIAAVHWLDYPGVIQNRDKMRSPLVIAAIDRYRAGVSYPLELIQDLNLA
jgi:ADP-ribose pyrophosphatase YjhB (NUDIX family)